MINQTLNNRYKITERLGKGAMGTVYKATDLQSEKVVAVKVIASDLAVDPSMLERFRREGETLRQLRHLNIVGFVDAFQYDDQYVIIMEYVSGGSLFELIKAGRLSIERAVQISLDLCDALIRSHRLKIIHRDIKPENVLIDEDGAPKLADFGVARLSEGTRMTRSGTQVGTPYYMAPEAWEGKTLDAQADIWSLGVVLFEMLTGKVPFGGDTGAAVMNKVLTTQPPNLKTLRNEAPSGMVKIVSRMLARDKKRRYQTMREIAVDLERGQQSITGLPAIKVKSVRWLPAWISLGLVLAISAVWLWTKPQGEQPAAQVADSTNTPRTTATIIRTIEPTSTPNPLALGERLEQCGSDLCIVDSQGKRTPIGLARQFVIYSTNEPHFGISPDGSKVVFSACLIETLSSGASCIPDLYIANRDGSNAVYLSGPPDNYQLWPSWSPDGELIVFNSGCGIQIIQPDGAGTRQIASGCLVAEAYMYAWSPDSQQIAWTGGQHSDVGEHNYDRLWVINRDGSGLRSLLVSSDPLFSGEVAWSPDGQSLAVGFQDGTTYVFSANCDSAPSGCDLSSATIIKEIPQDWLPTFRPQWLSAYADPQAAVNGCGFDDKLLFAENFENPDITQLGIWEVRESPDGQRALHALNPDVATAFVTLPLSSEPIIEKQISFDVMHIAPEWGLDFRIDPVRDRFNYDLSTAGNSLFKLRYWFGQDAHADLASITTLEPDVWTRVKIIWETENTIVVSLNDTEVIRYIEPNSVIERGRMQIWLYTANAEAWFDDIVICGQE